ncbi:MAG: ATP-binding protein [bacterium]
MVEPADLFSGREVRNAFINRDKQMAADSGKKKKKKESAVKGRKATSAQTPAKLRKLKTLLDVVERGKYFWESTFDAIIHPVMIVDRSYHIQRANLALAQAIGRDVRDLIWKKCHEVFAGRESPCGGCPLKQTWFHHQAVNSRVDRFSDGREYEATSFPLQGKNKDLDLYIVQYRDIREERQLQARLIQSEKMAAVGLLAGGIAHEINNPLSGILAFAQLALGQTEAGSQLNEDIREIETSALRCKKIVENLLEFSRQSSSEDRFELDLGEALQRVLPLLKVQIKEAGVYLETELAEDLPKILANSNQLEQVLLNLTSNACHALKSGGKVKIEVKQEDPDWIRIDFSDNGTGIPKGHLPKIFDPFFTTKKSGVGTGLGLSITYSIIQEHGGRIEVESEEGGGTLFRIFLPVAKAPPLERSSRAK